MVVKSFDGVALEQNRALLASESSKATRTLVSCVVDTVISVKTNYINNVIPARSEIGVLFA